ncbi:gas vesicle protein K [Streptosporangium sp. NPDC002544]|uniref:gas vesicle protein K n=1 Tax=Streptosporangium sp. NPDC002544 TaxID=3154538 RepID=UPI00333292AB
MNRPGGGPPAENLRETENPGVTRERLRAAAEDLRTARRTSGRARSVTPAKGTPASGRKDSVNTWEGFRNTRRAARDSRWRVNTDPEAVERDLTRLVLTLVELVRQLVERQCVRRMEQGDLTEEQVEVLGLTLMRLEEAMTELCERFGLSPSDLNLDLGPLGTLLPTD